MPPKRKPRQSRRRPSKVADQGLWVKLWCSALGDPDLDNLNIGDFGRACKLMLFIRQHGNSGCITLRRPSKVLCSMLQLPDFEAFMALLERIPNVTVSGNDDVTVSFRNWRKYQVDSSTERVRQWRERTRGVTENRNGKRSEEKRSEEKRKEVKKEKQGARRASLLPDAEFLESLKSNPAYRGINIEVELGKLNAWLLLPRQVAAGRTATRPTILSWLNRCDRPVATMATKKDSNYFGVREAPIIKGKADG
jgi:hypothetical protein